MLSNQDDANTSRAVEELINHCRDIQKILRDDQLLLSANDLLGLATNNHRKSVLLEKIMRQKTIITQSPNFAKHPNSHKKLELLKNELALCYQHTVTNYQVVFTNLMQLKNIWDQLLAAQEKTDCLYDHTGSLNK